MSSRVRFTGRVRRTEEEAASEDAASGNGQAPAEDAPDGDAAPKRLGPGDKLSDDELVERIAALLFASPEPVSTARLVALLDRPALPRVREALEALGQRLESARLPFCLRPIAGGWRLLTAPEMGDVVARLSKARKLERISPAGLETLSIVAYRQPVTKAEIEAIRGVQAGALLRSLVERGLVRITGRADQPGAPLQYGTTREFLDRFGLESLSDLPRDGELMRDE